MYNRKTIDTWVLCINYGYGQGYEEEVTEFSFSGIKARCKEYRENCPEYARKIIKRRERK
jgi:hypothetical protein